MKHIIRILVLCLVLCFLFGCAARQQPMEFYHQADGVETVFTLDPDACTITDGTHSYGYSISRSSGSMTITISYPNGGEYISTTQTQGAVTTGTGGFQGNMSQEGFADPETLSRFIESGIADSGKQYPVILSILLILLGLVPACFPRVVWFFLYGWQFRDAEPSDTALLVCRISGIVVILAGVVFLLL